MKRRILIVVFLLILVIFSGCKTEKVNKDSKENEKTDELEKTDVLDEPDPVKTEENIITVETELGKMKFKTVDGIYTDYIRDNAEIWSGKYFETVAENSFIQVPRTSKTVLEYTDTGIGCFYGSIGFVVDDDGNCTDSLVIITSKTLTGQSKSYMEKNISDTEKKEEYEKSGGVPELEGRVIIFGRIYVGEEFLDKIAASETNGYVNGFIAVEPVGIKSISHEKTTV